MLRALSLFSQAIELLESTDGYHRPEHLSPGVAEKLAKVDSLAPVAVRQTVDLHLPVYPLPPEQRILLVDAAFLTEMGVKGDLRRMHSASDLLTTGYLAWGPNQ